MGGIEVINRIRALLKSPDGRMAAVNAELPPAPEIELVVEGKLKLSHVPESGLKVILPYADF